MRTLDISGNRFGRLVAVRRIVKRTNRTRTSWLCLCDCGKTHTVTLHLLRSGKCKSCGCLRKEVTTKNKTTHGMKGSPEYSCWQNMKSRCDNPNSTQYTHYGRRGITYEKRWKRFENFFVDMGACPDGLTLERIDNSKSYSAENCKWATKAEQCRNQRSNINITHTGKTMCATDWARHLDIKPSRFLYWFHKGLSIPEIVVKDKELS